jgi:hypothetical protein
MPLAARLQETQKFNKTISSFRRPRTSLEERAHVVAIAQR